MVQIINAVGLDGQYLGFAIDTNGLLSKVVRKTIDRIVEAQPKNIGTLTSAPRDLLSLPQEFILDAEGQCIVPAGVDVHIHSREPGLIHKEDWLTVARGAYKGGVAAVADMPNTIPPTMSRDTVIHKAAMAARSGLDFRLLLGVGAKNLNQIAELLSDECLPICALKVFYGKTTGELMYDDLETLARVLPSDGKKLIVFHSEDQCMVDHNEFQYGKDNLLKTDNAAFNIHSLIRSSETAHSSTRTIIKWAETSYKRPIHIAHVSTPVEVEMIAASRAKGTAVTCEVAPHHVLLTTEDYERLGPLVKMNPPLRSRLEVEQLRRLIAQGAVDLFATDHAPHTLAEKRAPVGKVPSGVPSLELFWPLVLESARMCGISEKAGAEQILAMACSNPSKLFGFMGMGAITPGNRADFVVLSDDPCIVRSEEVVSKCGWTPYDGQTLPRSVMGTWVRGLRQYQSPNIEHID